MSRCPSIKDELDTEYFYLDSPSSLSRLTDAPCNIMLAAASCFDFDQTRENVIYQNMLTAYCNEHKCHPSTICYVPIEL